MPRSSKSQWDFGELFPAEATRKVLSVSELTQQVKRLLEKQVGQVWVTGEVTNLRAQASGHIYFTLKDAGSQLPCVLFRTEAVEHRELLQDGQKLLLQGELTVYEARGQYQLLVRQVELQGVGALQVAFEKLKQKLKAEGLFEAGRKRPLPRFPRRIGVVSSPTGAALQDVLHVVQRRNPALEMVLVPCRVQGAGAAQEIAAGIRLLNEAGAGLRLDMILVTRGGGSLEDLWAFNEEPVARAIFESALPVMSAVGHEIDFTISDFVADVRAATPSAGAELITESAYASRAFIAELPELLRQQVERRLNLAREEIDFTTQRLARLHPRRRLDEHAQRLDDAQSALIRCGRTHWRTATLHWQSAAARLQRVEPSAVLPPLQVRARELRRRLFELARYQLQGIIARQDRLNDRLRLLAPENILARGYSITTDAASGKVVRDAARVKPGQVLATRVNKGTVRSVVAD